MVWNALRAQQVTGGRHVAVYWTTEIRLEVGVETADAFVEQGDVVRSATPGGLTAFATHFGPYGELGSTHKAIQQWCATQGHKLAGPSWEIYGHWKPEWNDAPSQIRTDVFYLVTPG
jgi:Transcriptional regulator, effector-binding domain/component